MPAFDRDIEENGDEGPYIRQPISVLIQRLEARIETLTNVLVTLATKQEVADLERRVEILETEALERRSVMSHVQKSIQEAREWRRWIIPLTVSLALMVLTVLNILGYHK